MEKSLKNKQLKWHIDNYVPSIKAKPGSNKIDLWLLVVEIFNITLKIIWNLIFLGFPKNLKLIVYGKWFVTPDVYDKLTVRRGVAT